MENARALNKSRSQEDHWIPLSDLMTGMMMIFMLVAIIFMIQLKRDEKKNNSVAGAGQERCSTLL
jgi:hypothetical protein